MDIDNKENRTKGFAPPLWIKEKVQTNLDDFLCNVVYNVYECGCFLVNEFDKKRKGRERQVREPGQSRFVCQCQKEGRFICKVKICSECKSILISKKQKEGMCRGCSIDYNTRNDKTDLLFYQNGKLSDIIPQKPNYTECNCKHRGKCLRDIAPISEKNIRVYLWCYLCPKFEDERTV